MDILVAEAPNVSLLLIVVAAGWVVGVALSGTRD